MTDNNEAEEETAQPEETKTPEPRTFEITTLRTVEVDFNPRQLQIMQQQNDAEDAAEAIEQIFYQRATQQVEPEQKLKALDIDAHEPSND